MNIEDYKYKKSGRGYKVEITCGQCGIKIWKPWNTVLKGEGKFCSTKCGNDHKFMQAVGDREWRRGKSRHIEVKINCELCGTERWVKLSRVKEGRGRFCSLKCSNTVTSRSRPQHLGKENAGKSWDSAGGKYIAYWKDTAGKQYSMSYAKWLWEKPNGEVPEGYVVTYKDRNPKNCELENLEVITRGKRTSEALIGHEVSDEARANMSKSKIGKPLSESHKENIGKASKKLWEDGVFDEVHYGEYSYKWRGGIDGKYPKEFNAKLKHEVRKRDKSRCRICTKKKLTNIELPIHHIDGNRSNNDKINLISLCTSCHGKVHGKHPVDDPQIMAFRSMLNY